eukprot:TRINITY_DN3051_c0_g1_i11.p1 TRINITY_DN3051_c0_g1~~TRINITY_DN3051_c0_g1_i11.p1  ORF type:complete len:441 (-),score=74.36 TRINITY_DN3051_c0_g1_i11:335-1657(-)
MVNLKYGLRSPCEKSVKLTMVIKYARFRKKIGRIQTKRLTSGCLFLAGVQKALYSRIKYSIGVVGFGKRIAGVVQRDHRRMQVFKNRRSDELLQRVCGVCAGQSAENTKLNTLAEVRDDKTEAPDVSNKKSQERLLVTTEIEDTSKNVGSGDAEEPGISWDVDITATAEQTESQQDAGVGISWDVEVPTEDLQQIGEGEGGGDGGSISWDIEVPIETQGGGEAGDSGIDWGIDVQDVSYEQEKQRALLESNQQRASQQQDDAQFLQWSPTIQRVVEDGDYRNKLLDDLYELKAFITQRRTEMSSKGHEGMLSVQPENVQRIGRDTCDNMLQVVNDILSQFHNERVKFLLMIKTSKRFLERMQRQLEQQSGQESKLKGLDVEIGKKREETQRQLMGAAPKLKALIQRMKTVKIAVEEELKKQFQGRRIKIIGEINNIMQSV